MLVRSLLALVIALIVICALLYQREAGYGTGPKDTSSAPKGETVEVAFASNAVAGTISIIDLERMEVVATLNGVPDGTNVSFFRDPIQSFAQEIAQASGGLNYGQDTDLSRDGTVLYVSRGFLGDVIALDIATDSVLWRTPIAGVRSDHMDISPDGKRLYVSALIRGGDVVEVLDTANGKKLGSFKTGLWPHDVHVTADNKTVYVASLGDMQLEVGERGEDPNAYKVTLADTDTLEIIREHSFDEGIRPFQVTKDGKQLYAQLSNTHDVVARNLETDMDIARISLPVAEGVSEDDWDFEAPHHGLAMTKDEKTLCIAGRASDYAAILTTDPLALVTTIPTGDAPSWSTLTEDDRLCLVANTRSDDVSVIDLDNAEEIARIPVGRGVKHITVGRVPVELLEGLR